MGMLKGQGHTVGPVSRRFASFLFQNVNLKTNGQCHG